MPAPANRIPSRVPMTAATSHSPPPSQRPTSPLSVTTSDAVTSQPQTTPPSPQLPTTPPLYSIAPMMDVTDRHFRTLARLISRHATLYTEMVVDRTLIHNPKLRLLELRLPEMPLSQHPVVLQLGGSDAALMAQAASFAATYPYAEVNINCGCPSPKVADNGCFGAALMRSPNLVADIAAAMRERLRVDVTVKCRLGLDDDMSYESLRNFVQVVHMRGGVTHFIVHARNAILGGLSPAQNRSIPPLRYDVVYRLVRDFPHVRFSINGGVKSIEDVLHHLQQGVYGVMVGRAVMDAPWRALRDVDARIYGRPNVGEDGMPITRRDVLREYKRYARREVEETACSVRAVVKPLLNLFHGERNGKMWRRAIDDGLRVGLGVESVIDSAIEVVPEDVMDVGCGTFVGEEGLDLGRQAEDARLLEGRVGGGDCVAVAVGE